MNDSQRKYYAQRFNSYPRNVRTWEELTDTQRREASCMFVGNGPEWVYLATNYGNGVLARRRKEANIP